MTIQYLFYFLVFLVAFLYSTVGHGGASGYLALMALFSYSTESMRSTALLLNIVVSLLAFIQFYRAGYFQWKLFIPFAITSIPAAFVGGLIIMDASLYKHILAILLIFPVIKLIGIIPQRENIEKPLNIYAALTIGVFIGFISGIIGIGGGIILSPVILLMHWANMKQTAAVSSLFILVNSLAGLAGIFINQFHFESEMQLLLLLALAGGLSGAYLGAMKFNIPFLRKLLAVVLLIASIKLIST